MNHPTIHILYIEDSIDDAELLKLALNRSKLDYQLKHVLGLETLNDELQGHHYDLVISDFDLKGFNGLDVIQLVRAQDSILPIIILSGTVGEERAVQLIKSGASDFYLKENLGQLPKEIFKVLDAANEKRTSQAYKEKLEAQSTIFDTLMHSIEDFIFLKDKDHRYIKVNEAMASYFRVREEEFEGRTDKELQFDSFLEESISTDNEVFEQGKAIRFETEYINLKGERVILETLKSPIMSKGEINGLVGVSRNITEQKIYEEEISRNERMLSQAESVTSSASFQYDAEVDLITCSKNFTKLMGLPASENQFSLRRMTKLVHEGDRNLLAVAIENAIDHSEEFNMEFRYMTDNGNIRFGRIKLSPSSETSLFFGMIVDITKDRVSSMAIQNIQEKERKRISQELHDNLGQKLSAAKMYLDYAKNLEGSDKVYHKLYEIIHESVRDVRNISRELSTKLVEESGLSHAIDQLLTTIPEPLTISSQIEIDDSSVEDFVGGNIFRIIQEAITNTLKYAEAKEFKLYLSQNAKFLELRMEDNGKGFRLDDDVKYGNGLRNIEHRVKTCNGILKIETAPDRGTAIIAQIPPN